MNGEVTAAPISKPDLHMETVARLAQLVAVASPGSRLPTERELCEQLGVGRSTLREAVRALAFIGAVEPRQGSGTFVGGDPDSVDRLIGLGLVLNRSRVHEILEVRRFLESESARLAAERPTDEDAAGLRAAIEGMRERRSDPSAASHDDLDYHVRLVRASRNRVLEHLLTGMRLLLESWIRVPMQTEEIFSAAVSEHERILEAVLARNADEAERLMDEHQRASADRIFKHVGREDSTAEYISLLLRSH
jgi:GntR family transcriptional repressor for pyruvate dehydrogenase complex